MFFFSSFIFAHRPDISSLMIYEQNGKTFIVIKTSLTAFEGEINYHYTQNAYKTPQEFNELVIKHFKKSTLVVVNNDTLTYKNPRIQLGHETTIFAELEKMPKKITSYYVKNRFFKDMPSNQCELILIHKELPKKQIVLDHKNNYEIKLSFENNQWSIEENRSPIFSTYNPLFWGLIFSVFSLTAFILLKKKHTI